MALDDEKKKGSPDIGKGSEVKEGSTSPEIGKGEELESLDEFDESAAPSETEQGEGGLLSTETQEYLKGKGFKSADELVKSHESLEKRQTELTRDARLTRLGNVGAYPQRVGDGKAAERKKIEIPEDPSELLYDKDKFTTFLDSYGKEVEARTLDRVDEHLAKGEEQRILTDYEDIRQKDPARFEELRGTMFNLSKRFPNASMKDLYDEADSLHVEEKEKASAEVIEGAFGPGVDRDKLRMLVSKMKPAPLSSGSGGGQEITVTPSSDIRERAKQVKKDILGATKLTDD